MPDIGWMELMVIGIVALIVVGPKDLPVMFRKAGLFMGRIKGMAREFTSAMNDAADQTGMREMNREMTETLSQLDIPTLILCGRDDRLCPISRHELMAGLVQGSRLEIIENAGHLPTLENPQDTNAALARWLEER